MSYKKLKYDEFPQKFDRHVVIDVRTMTSHFITSPTAIGALLQHAQSLGYEEFTALPEADQQELMDIGIKEVESILGLSLYEDKSLFYVISAGPFTTTAGRQAMKNMNFCITRFLDLVKTGRAATDEEKQAADWLIEHQAKSRARVENKDSGAEEEAAEILRKIFGGRGLGL